MALKIRKIKGKSYYYLDKNIRLGENEWKTFSVYIGSKKPTPTEYKKFEAALNRQVANYVRRAILRPDTEFINEKTAFLLERIKAVYKRIPSMAGKKKLVEYLKMQRETFITNTNAIEGSRVTLEQTKRILELIDNFAPQDRDEIEVVNMKNALDKYELLVGKKAKLDEKIILAIHATILKGIPRYEKYAGTWRDVNVYIRGCKYVFPDWKDVPVLMKQLLGWYEKNKDQLHPVELAAKFHAKFVTIHPFADGNGRMARLLMNYILQINSFPFTDVPFSKRDEYFDCQEAAHFGHYRLFVDFLVKEIQEEYKAFRKSMARKAS
ncbi:MAG: Fic family protein [Candidatus Micrarchaeota archaeon]